MARQLTDPRSPVLITEPAVAQDIGRITIDIAMRVDGDTGAIVVDTNRVALTYELNDIAANAHLLRGQAVVIRLADMPAAARNGLRDLRAWLMQHAEQQGLLAPGTDDATL